jgi:hypothetical protein
MINLIPPSAKRGVTYEYWKRVITVWLYLASAALVILTVFLLPTQVVLRSEIQTLTDIVNAGVDRVANYDISATELVEASGLARLLLENQATNTPSELINILTKHAGGTVVLSNFQFTKLTTLGGITLSGMAQSRQALAQFRDTVTADAHFSAVNLPISNLIKDKDLLFSMEITLATTTP